MLDFTKVKFSEESLGDKKLKIIGTMAFRATIGCDRDEIHENPGTLASCQEQVIEMIHYTIYGDLRTPLETLKTLCRRHLEPAAREEAEKIIQQIDQLLEIKRPAPISIKSILDAGKHLPISLSTFQCSVGDEVLGRINRDPEMRPSSLKTCFPGMNISLDRTLPKNVAEFRDHTGKVLQRFILTD